MPIGAGDKVPDFDLPTDGGGALTPDRLAGGKVVLYFYPKDSTPGCTMEAQAFRDRIEAFEALGAVVVGVSKDSVRRHDNFKAKHDLPFTLVSDTDGALCEAFGVWVEKKLYGRRYMGIERATFLIDETGVIREVWRNVKVKGHAEVVLDRIKDL